MGAACRLAISFADAAVLQRMQNRIEQLSNNWDPASREVFTLCLPDLGLREGKGKGKGNGEEKDEPKGRGKGKGGKGEPVGKGKGKGEDKSSKGDAWGDKG